MFGFWPGVGLLECSPLCKGGGYEANPCRVNRRAVGQKVVKGFSVAGALNLAGNIPAGNVVSKARGIRPDIRDRHAPSDYV